MSTDVPGLEIASGVVTTTPAAFQAAIELVARDSLRGISIREDFLDQQKDAPACDLKALRRVPHLEHFSVPPGLHQRRLTNFEFLYELVEIRELGIHNYDALDLRRFPLLQELFVQDQPGLSGLDSEIPLRSLQVWGLRRHDVGLPALRGLQSFVITQPSTHLRALVGLETLGSLANLQIRNARALASLGTLPARLAVLKVESCARLADLSFLEGNESIDFLFATTMESLAFVPSMGAHLRLGFGDVKNGDLSPILKSATLRSVFFSDRKKYSISHSEIQRELTRRFGPQT